MNDGKPVLSTSTPLRKPIPRLAIAATAIAGQMFQPYSTVSKASTIPDAPMTEPIERSNSPPIINRQIAAARMPSWAETSR